MGPLSRWAVRRPVLALVGWGILMAAIFGLGLAFKGEYNDSFALPDTDSTRAQSLLEQVPGGAEAAFGTSATLVWAPSSDSGKVTDATVAEPVSALLQRLSTLPGVACVTNPYGQLAALQAQGQAQGQSPDAGTGAAAGTGVPVTFGTGCPAPDAGGGAQQQQAAIAALPADQRAAVVTAAAAATKATLPVSPDQRVAKATVTFSGAGDSIPVTTARQILDDVKAANTGAVTIGASGQALEFASVEPPSSEAIGLVAAIVILLIAFGSLVAAGLPIVVALFGLSLGQMLVLITANFLDVASFAPTLAAMIGLGVGIDYALFVLNRFRQALQHGRDPHGAALEAVSTAGRSVVFAASTVIIGLLGLFVLRIDFFNGLAVAATVTVLMVALSALWLLPALLGLLKGRTLALRMPWARKQKDHVHQDGSRWAHYGAMLQRRPWLYTIAALAVVVVLALPTLALRLGFADDSGKPVNSPARIAYDLSSEGFGPGSNGPFYVAVQLPKAGDVQALGGLVTALENTPGVARTLPSSEMLPAVGLQLKDSTVTAVQVVPTTAPQDEATSALLTTLREQTIPQATAGTGVVAYVGGTQAITEDFTNVLISKLPQFLAIVVGLGFLALVLLFRSVLVPLTAAVTSLLSFGAALGITVAVFQWGWGADLLGISGTGPILPFLPIMVFGILFGLSMDYQVFLASRMQEEHLRTDDNAKAVRRGLAGSGRVVMIAALIMTSVFAAFIPTNNATIKLFGIALASAVLIDAFVVRLVLVPSLMSILGKANWWLPRWLDRILPTLRIEDHGDEVVDDPDLDTSPGGDGVGDADAALSGSR